MIGRERRSARCKKRENEGGGKEGELDNYTDYRQRAEN